MITPDNKLKVFENFRVDRNLLKFALEDQPRAVNVSFGTEDSFMLHDESEGELIISKNPWGKRKRGFWDWVGSMIVTAWHSFFALKTKSPVPTMTVREFFTSVSNSTQELDVVRGRAAGYEVALVQAKNCGQTALLEKLKKGIETCRNESQLVSISSRKYLTEEDLVRFIKASPKGLRLDWIRNFTRMIPLPVAEKKACMDNLGIFDNYVVLHYDPDKKSWAETQAEVAARKDPILFGLMEGSRKLYFVGDWVDEQCDLTLEQIVDLLGVDVVKDIP
jgi:hypothetical protein